MAAADSKLPKRNRKDFVRPQIPVVERVASGVILVLIAGIGVAIWIKGHHFDPGLYSLRPDALKSTANAIEGKSSTLRVSASDRATEGTPSVPVVAPEKAAVHEAESAEAAPEEGAAKATTAAATGEPLELGLPGLTPMGKTEFYNAANLFEKIDGRSPAYEAFNVQQLRCRSFGLDGSGGSYVDVYEYRFDTPINAFGMFAQERDPKGKPLDFATDGYASEMGFFFRQGAVYVQLLCSDQKPATLAVAKTIVENRMKVLPADDTGLAARRKLPAAGMIADSVTFVPENALGQSFLNNVFQATYDFNGAKLTFFLMTTTPEAAATAWKSFLTFSVKYGGTANELPAVGDAKIFSAQNFGKSKIIYQREGEIGGIIDAADADVARQFVEKYLAGEIK